MDGPSSRHLIFHQIDELKATFKTGNGDEPRLRDVDMMLEMMCAEGVLEWLVTRRYGALTDCP